MEENDIGGIRCLELLEVLSAYVDGELSQADRARVAAHVAECRNCARFGESFASVVGSLARLGREAIDPEEWEPVVSRALSRDEK